MSIYLFACEMGGSVKTKKPFIIIEKDHIYGKEWRYMYEDKNGNKHTFSDTVYYFIGDTIK